MPFGTKKTHQKCGTNGKHYIISQKNVESMLNTIYIFLLDKAGLMQMKSIIFFI